MKKPFVLAISSISGGGRTTITRELCSQLHNARALYFDEYEFTKQPGNICEWVEKGSDLDDWDLSLLREDVIRMIEEEELEYLILDYPFAKQHGQLKDFIDRTIYIDTPLDIALARRMIRDYKGASTYQIISELSFYLEKSRVCFTDHMKQMKACDLIIDGSLDVLEIVNIINKKIVLGF